MNGITARRLCALASLVLLTRLAHAAPDSRCAVKPSSDANLKAIVSEVFYGKATRLAKEGLISPDFHARIANARFEICVDRIWDVVLLPGSPPTIVFDEQFLRLLAQEAQVLVLGQLLSQKHPKLQTLDLHGALMRHVLAQNIAAAKPTSLESMVQQLVGQPVDLAPYMDDPRTSEHTEKMFLQALYFLTFHEFCHIKADHLTARKRINGMQDADLPAGKTKSDLLVQLEIEADACSRELINRDEAQFKASPVSFISVFLVASTQGVFYRVLQANQQPITHPGALERLGLAYQDSLNAIKGTEHEARYRATLDGMHQHFKGLLEFSGR